jgi:hypothetical protein
MKMENETFETIPGMGVEGINENEGGDEFKYDIFDILYP